MRILCIEDKPEWGLIKGAGYIVYGITIHNENINYLICDKNDWPYFHNKNYFKIISSHIPSIWQVRTYTVEENQSHDTGFGYKIISDMVIGYKKLLNYQHRANLIEHIDIDRIAFYQKKLLIDLEELKFMLVDLANKKNTISEQDIQNFQNQIATEFSDNEIINKIIENINYLKEYKDKLTFLKLELEELSKDR